MQRKVLLVDAEPALAGLLDEWLAARGCTVEQIAGAADGYDLIVVDVPFPRQTAGVLKELARTHPGTPVLALSSSFFPGIDRTGSVARALGVAGVLPKPVTEEALNGALDAILGAGKTE